MIFLPGVLQRILRAGAQKKAEDACQEGSHGNTDFLGVIVLGVFLGIVIISLLSLAQKGEQVYDFMYRGEARATPADSLYQPASETLSPTSGGEARPQRDLGASAAVP
jgi:hypothetical protein